VPAAGSSEVPCPVYYKMQSNKGIMSLNWISHPILCHGKIVSNAISSKEPLLPNRNAIVYRALLLFNAWQEYACEGRQMSSDDFERLEEFEIRFVDQSLSESSFRQLCEDFGEFIPIFLTAGKIDISNQVLNWTQQKLS
jgi:hypothetical protein